MSGRAAKPSLLGKSAVRPSLGVGSAVSGAEAEMTTQPHADGWREHLALAHASPRCGAKRRDGGFCCGPAMPNGRCRMHGGMSPGAPKGNKNAFKHGYDCAEAQRQRAEARLQARELRELVRALGMARFRAVRA